jgi:hypothetical protein
MIELTNHPFLVSATTVDTSTRFPAIIVLFLLPSSPLAPHAKTCPSPLTSHAEADLQLRRTGIQETLLGFLEVDDGPDGVEVLGEESVQ